MFGGIMTTLALIFGLLLGLLFSRFRLRRLMLLAYHLPFRFWRSYDELYDVAEVSLISDLDTYQRLQPRAKSAFKSLWDAFAWQCARDYGLALATSLALFWDGYKIFVITFVVTQAVYLVYIHFYKGYRLDFFAVLMIKCMLSKQF